MCRRHIEFAQRGRTLERETHVVFTTRCIDDTSPFAVRASLDERESRAPSLTPQASQFLGVNRSRTQSLVLELPFKEKRRNMKTIIVRNAQLSVSFAYILRCIFPLPSAIVSGELNIFVSEVEELFYLRVMK
jgi:hypothetical protein